jgi:hypothetical protein
VATLRGLLRRLTPAAAAMPLHRDLLGRPTPAEGCLKVALSRHANKLAVAVSTGAPVEVSLQRVPETVTEAMRPMLTPREQTMIAGLAPLVGGERFARRGVEALRVTTDQDLVLVLDADGRSCRSVGVYDLPRLDGFVAAVASTRPPGRSGPWLVGDHDAEPAG